MYKLPSKAMYKIHMTLMRVIDSEEEACESRIGEKFFYIYYNFILFTYTNYFFIQNIVLELKIH